MYHWWWILHLGYVQEVDLTEVYRIIEELRGDVKINQAALDYFEARLNEFKTEQSNPLLN